MKKILAAVISCFAISALLLTADSSGGKLTCCQEAATQGRECPHKCCSAAHRAGKSCRKCNPDGEDLIVTKNGQQVFYVQFVIGGDQDKLPFASAKPIGPKLEKKLRGVFRWKRYWEVNRDSVVLASGQMARRKVSSDREVEIERLDSEKFAVRIYHDGKLTRNRTQPSEGAFCITGGGAGADQSWFIVVRRDRPVPNVQATN